MALAETSPPDLTSAVAAVPAVAVAPPRTVAGRLLGGRGFVACCLVADAFALLAAAAVFGDRALADPVTGVLLAVTLVALGWRGLYDGDARRSPVDLVGPIAAAVALGWLTAVAVDAQLADDPAEHGRVALAVGLGAAVGIIAARAALLTLRRRARARGAALRRTLIVGAGEVGRRIADRLLTDPGLGLLPVGFVDVPGEASDDGAPALPVLGPYEALPELAAATGARQLIVAFPAGARDVDLRPAVARCERDGVRVAVVPRLFESLNGRTAYEPLGALPLLGLRSVDPHGWRFAVKHGVDFVVAFTGLVLLAPVLVVIAAAVRLESSGPALFRQRRVGRDGQVFDVLKFRSMRIDGDDGDFVPPAGSAPGGVEGIDRRTPLGRLLRRTSLDELPQLVNVVRGEMSLVGPRPERPEFAETFARDVRRYGDRHRVRAGITGWAQVNGCRGQTSLADRIECDNFYIEHWSLSFDLKIICKTVVAVFRSPEA